MRRISSVLFAASVAVLLGMPAAASADAIMPPPRDCPSGAIGSSSHYGQHCAPDRCESDPTCATSDYNGRPAGRTCSEASFCVRETLHESPRGNTLVTALVGPCEADGTCAQGECQTGRYCLESDADPAPDPDPSPGPEPEPEPTTDPEPVPADGGGCSVGHGALRGLGVSVLALLAGLLYRRTRRR